MPNEIVLKIGAEGDVGPGVDAAVSQAKAAQADLSAATAKAAQEDAEHLKLVEAQYGQLGPAAAKAYAQASAAADAAGEAVARAGKQAETGSRGYEKGAALAASAINKLEQEIEQLRASGVDVGALENRLESLRKEAQQNSRTFGEFRKNLRDVQDETKIATRAAGEFEGTLTSLEDVVNSVNPALGNQVVKLLAVQSALTIVQQIGREASSTIKDLALSLGASQERADQLAKSLDDKFSLNPFRFFGSFVKDAQQSQDRFFENFSENLAESVEETQRSSGALAEYALNLRNVLSGQGYDVARASLEQLLVMEEEWRKRVEARGPAIEKLATQIRGDQKALRDDTAVTLGALAKIGDAELQNSETAKKAAEVVRELIARYKEAGEAIPDVLEEWSRRLQALVQDHENLATILDRVLQGLGIRGPAAIDKQIDALREYAGEVERSGRVTADQAGLILGNIDQIRRAVELLPEAQQAAAAGMLQALDELEERYRGIATVALSSFGVQTPEAIDRSIVKIEGLINAFGPLGKVTAEQAAVVVGELQKILDAISVLPAEQRAAMSEQETAIRALADQYGDIAVRRQQYAKDIIAEEEEQLAREKEIIEERKALLATFASTFEQLQAKLNGKSDGGAAEDIAALKQELAGLEDQDFLSPEQLERMNTLKGQIAGATQATFEFGEGQKEAALSVGEVDDALAGLIDSLKATEGGFANLPLASRDAIEVMLGRLQQTAAEGHATGDVLQDTFTTVGRIVDEAGGSMGELGTALNRAGEDTLNLRREFGELEAGIQKTADAEGKLGDARKDSAAAAKEAAETSRKATEAQAEAMGNLEAAAKKANEQLSSNLAIVQQTLAASLALKECWATTSIG